MSGDTISIVVASFAPEQYERVLGVMDDAVLLPRSHAAWRRGFEERLEALARQAITPVVVTLDPEAFSAWCEEEELPRDARARLEYADWLAAREALPRIDAESALRRAEGTARDPRSAVATDSDTDLAEVAA
jgi:hypothetical protein